MKKQAQVLLEVCAVMQLYVLYMYVKLYLSSLRLMRWKSHAAELWTLTAPYSHAAPSASRRKCAMEEVVMSRSPCKSYIAEVCYTPTPCSKYEGPCMKPSQPLKLFTFSQHRKTRKLRVWSPNRKPILRTASSDFHLERVPVHLGPGSSHALHPLTLKPKPQPLSV